MIRTSTNKFMIKLPKSDTNKFILLLTIKKLFNHSFNFIINSIILFHPYLSHLYYNLPYNKWTLASSTSTWSSPYNSSGTLTLPPRGATGSRSKPILNQSCLTSSITRMRICRSLSCSCTGTTLPKWSVILKTKLQRGLLIWVILRVWLIRRRAHLPRCHFLSSTTVNVYYYLFQGERVRLKLVG